MVIFIAEVDVIIKVNLEVVIIILWVKVACSFLKIVHLKICLTILIVDDVQDSLLVYLHT